jgi:acetylornithine aminotransferase/acetylornithine/N-succinyldiaminopimelate aminotransferase
MHGTTFGGGPLACAVAIAVIDAIEENHLLEHVVEIGEYFQAQLRLLAERHSCILDVRGKGVMIAAELNSADLGKHTVLEMLKHHVVINCTSDTTLRFLPPYIFERVHVDTTIAALDAVFTEYASTGADQAVAVAAGGTNHG